MGYTKNSLQGVGAIAGKPCQIQNIESITGGSRVTFLWVDNSDIEHTNTMDVMNGANGQDGVNGVGIASAVINENSHLIITYTDGTTTDAGTVDFGDGFSATATLLANGWVNNQQTITFTGYIASMSGIVGVPTTATSEQVTAYKNAVITVYQSGTSFVFTCENVPNIDLPISFYGGGSNSGGSASWGNITGTLSNQTDLQTVLNAKAEIDDTTAANNKVYSSQKVNTLLSTKASMSEVEAYVNAVMLGGAD